MSIRIESLPLDYVNPPIAPPESEVSLLNSRDRGWYHDPDYLPESAHLYGGTAATLTMMLSPRLDRNRSSTPDRPPPVTFPTTDWSTSLQTVLDRPTSALPNRLVAGGVLFCAAFVAWATVGQMDQVGRAQGRLIPQGEPYKVHPTVAGKIARVYVREGQVVKAGQVVAELDHEIALNRVEWLQQEHANYEKELIQTESLVEKTRLEAETRIAITNAEVNAQMATIAQSQAKIASQKAVIIQAEERASTNQTLVSELQTDATAQTERMARLKHLVDEGALAREQLFQAERSLGDRQRTITQQMGDIQQTFAESQRLRADLQQVMAETQRLHAELARKYAEGHSAQLQAQQSIQQLLVQKTQLQAKIQQNEKQLVQAKTELKQLTLRAPVSGTVLALNVRNQGEVVQPGQTIAEMAPQGAPLILEAALPTREAGFVKVGDHTQIKFDAYPYQDYGIASGQVTAISPDARPDERLGAIYRVEIALDQKSLAVDHPMIQLKAGQTATAEIVIRQRRIVDILLEPIRQLQKSGLKL
jgi:hemolysin D